VLNLAVRSTAGQPGEEAHLDGDVRAEGPQAAGGVYEGVAQPRSPDQWLQAVRQLGEHNGLCPDGADLGDLVLHGHPNDAVALEVDPDDVLTEGEGAVAGPDDPTVRLGEAGQP